LTTGLDSVDRKLMDRVVHHFRSIHKRDPTEQEHANLWSFLTTGGLPSYTNESEQQNKENSSPPVKKMNFDSDEDDSDYVPEQDCTSPSQDTSDVADEVEDNQEKCVEIPSN